MRRAPARPGRRHDRGRIACGMMLAPVLLAVACAPRPRPPPPSPDPPVAHVGGETLHLSDVVRAAHARDPASASQPLDPNSELYRASLQAAIDQRLLALEAIKLHLERDPRVKRRLAAARDKVLGDAALDHEIESQVSPAALRALYDDEVRQAHPVDELDLAQIITPTEAEAQSVVAQLKAADADFGALAQNRSTDLATRFSGGELGWVAPSALPPALGAAVAAAQPGQVVGPLRLPQGFAVVKVKGRRPQAIPSFEAARPQLVRYLAYDRLQSLLKRLRSGSEIAILKPQPSVPSAPSNAVAP